MARQTLHLAFLVTTVLLTGAFPVVAEPDAVSGQFQINAETTDDQDTASVAIAPGGSFVVVWESFGQDSSMNGVFLRAFNAVGQPLAGEQQVNTHTPDEQEDPDIARLVDGRYIVVWDSDGAQDGEQRGIYGRLFDASGLALGAPFLVNAVTAGDQNDAVVAAAADGGFFVVWETQPGGDPFEELVARRFDATGMPVTGEVAVNVYTTGDQEDADVASDVDGNFVVAWESDVQDGHFESVVARRFDAGGQPLGDEFVVNTYTTGDQDDPDLAVHPDGRFVITWEDDTQDMGVDAIYARYYAADGTPTSDAFKVDTDSGPELDPRVAIDREGYALVIWDGFGQDGSGFGVFVNRFDPTGSAAGPEQQVNTNTAGDQEFPHIAVAPGGEVVTVWESDTGGPFSTGSNVKARRYRAFVFADGFESGSLSAWSTSQP